MQLIQRSRPGPRVSEANVVECNIRSVNIVLDTDVLIKLAKTSAKETVASNFRVFVPPEVRRESVDEGKAKGFPDAARIQQNIRAGLVRVQRPRRIEPTEALIRGLRVASGEADVLRLFRSGGMDAVVSDDRRFLQTLEALGIPFATSSSLLVGMVRLKRIGVREGLALLEKLTGFVGDSEYLEARRVLEGR